MADYSNYTDEELEHIAQGGSAPSRASPKQSSEPGGLRSLGSYLGHGYMNYAKGALKGMGQAAGDLGASAINWPISGIESLTGAHIPHVPHPNLINQNPESLGENVGQILGQLTGGLALPGGTGMKAAQLAGKGYQTLRAGKELPLIGKLLAGGAGGALEGAAGNEENRGLGGLLGSVAGTVGHAIPAAFDFAKSIGSKNIAKNIQEEVARLGQHFNERFTSHLRAGEEAGANDFLRGEKGNISLLKKAGEHGKNKGEKGLTYALEEYNKNPTLMGAHNAQRDLGKIERMHEGAPKGSLEDSAYKEALKLKNRILQKISESFEKSGVKEHGAGYQQSRVDYANQMAPYKESETIGGLLGKNKRGVQTIRPKEFADKLLQEEDFMTQAGNNHPGLMRRERYNKVKKNKFAQGAALGSATAATAFLPYGISKALGLK